jgi:hypothetical protein
MFLKVIKSIIVSLMAFVTRKSRFYVLRFTLLIGIDEIIEAIIEKLYGRPIFE